MYRAHWFMKLYGGPTDKPHVGYSNSSWVSALNAGRLVRKKTSPFTRAANKTTTSYRNAGGVIKFHGNSALKDSQQGAYKFECLS